MALLFADSFSHYSAAQIPRKWGSTGANVSLVGAGRHGSVCARLANVNNAVLYKDLPDHYPTLIVGCAIKIPSFATAGDAPFIRLQEGNGSTTHGFIYLNANGTIRIARGDLGTLATSTLVLLPATWYYVEFKYTPADTGGYGEVRVDGIPWVVFTGDTRSGGTTGTLHRVQLGNNGGSIANLDVCDLVIMDTSGPDCNDFLGDVRVDATLPAGGAGTYTEWTPSTLTNIQCVDEVPANDDTDYVHTLTPAARDLYQYADIAPSGGNVKAVLVQYVAKKDDVGSRNVQSLVRTGGVDYPGAAQSLFESYAQYTEILSRNPQTAAPWTIAEVNSAEYGVKLVS